MTKLLALTTLDIVCVRWRTVIPAKQLQSISLSLSGALSHRFPRKCNKPQMHFSTKKKKKMCKR